MARYACPDCDGSGKCAECFGTGINTRLNDSEPKCGKVFGERSVCRMPGNRQQFRLGATTRRID
jgi:hypothetical protein